jgi:glutaminyl-peptide cyclotransferase
MKRRLALALVVLALVPNGTGCRTAGNRFDGDRAYAHVERLCDLGPRPVGSEALRKAADYIRGALADNGWEVDTQEFANQGEVLCNVIGRKGSGPLIILGTHYDTRPLADRDPVDRSRPVMGANDGGSGVAVLLELARALDESAIGETEIWLAFFDGEDRGGIDGWPWCVGSRFMAETLAQDLDHRPEYVLIVDMVGDADQRIYYEWSSALWLQERLWRIAADLGYGEHFVAKHRYTIVDDHTPFLEWGMGAALVIDFDYPYWHTCHDTLDKISVDSLQRVGDVVETLLEGEPLGAWPAERGEQ